MQSPASWNCWVFWLGDNQQHLFPPIRFYNGYCTIGFTWSMLFLWYDSVLWDANLVDDRATCFFWIYEVLKWFTPCWTSDFFRYIMKDVMLDLQQCAIPWSWDCWVFWVGGNQQYLVPPIRFYNGFHLINALFVWNLMLIDVIWKCAMGCKSGWLQGYVDFWDFMRF